ncbi:MAG: NlpC/P60 family protein [Cohaesibacteraceae bacterium]
MSAPTRSALVAEAERWIGTPYCHQASRRGAGTDCLGLVMGIWNAVAGSTITLSRADQKHWAQHAKGEPLLHGLRAHLAEIDPLQALPGDLVALRWRHGWPASHLAFVMGDGTIIHAYEGGAVVRSHLTPWTQHIAAAFTFPGMSEDTTAPLSKDI